MMQSNKIRSGTQLKKNSNDSYEQIMRVRWDDNGFFYLTSGREFDHCFEYGVVLKLVDSIYSFNGPTGCEWLIIGLTHYTKTGF